MIENVVNADKWLKSVFWMMEQEEISRKREEIGGKEKMEKKRAKLWKLIYLIVINLFRIWNFYKKKIFTLIYF